MYLWLRIEKDKVCSSREQLPDDLDYSLSLGSEPMKPNMFEAIVPGIVEKLYYQNRGYFTVSYDPIRRDGLSAIQIARPQYDEEFHLEVVIKSDHWRGYTIYAKYSVTYDEVLSYFKQVLVDEECPQVRNWEDITDNANYL